MTRQSFAIQGGGRVVRVLPPPVLLTFANTDDCQCRARAAMNALLYLPPSARPFRRFAVGRRDEDVAHLPGPFRFAGRDGAASPLPDEVEEIYEWFREYLKVPPRSVFELRFGAACWFRNDAPGPLAVTERLSRLLERLGHPMRVIASHRPGRIIYFDEVQIVTRRPLPGRRRDCHVEIPVG